NAHGPRSEWVVEQGVALAGDALAYPPGHEGPPFADRLPAQSGEGDDPQDLRDRELLEDRLVVPGRELDSVTIEGALRRGAVGDGLRVEQVRAPREVLGRSRALAAEHGPQG